MSSDSRRFPWVLLLVVLLTCISASLNMHKIPPTLPILMKTFHMNAKQGGSLMSIFFFLALVVGLPAGFIFQRMGQRVSGCAGILLIAAGSVVGGLSNGYGLMFLSRFIEGIGFCWVTVVGYAVIGQRFPKENKGIAMGILSLYLTCGSVLAFSITPFVVSHWGWRGLWWGGALFSVVMLFVFYFFAQPAPAGVGAAPESRPRASQPDRSALRNTRIYMCVLAITCLLFLIQGLVTWLPAYLVRIQRYTLAQASFVLTVRSAFVIPSNLIGGWLTDRFGWRPVCVIPMFIDAVLMPLSAFVTGWPLYALVSTQGLVGGIVAPAVMTGSSEMAGPRQQGVAMAMMGIGRDVGALLGPVALGAIVDGWGWVPAFMLLGPVGVLGGLSALFIFQRNLRAQARRGAVETA